jgi:hypothetical protein
MRSFYGSNQFVKLKLHGSTVPILCVLDQEYHQERNDGRAGIYSQLPGIAEPKQRAGNGPNYDDKHGSSKGGTGYPVVREARLAKLSNRVL